ncbi:MAG TPA: DUF4870 domain-containing protein [Ktedonosporobacter sp.]|jgi:uncharacterized membrane protein|nr:DUF4870 domain-containing protein [Ktedonosporobacter sp.]
MGTNPYQGQNPDQSNQYGGYSGYTPPAQQGASYGQQGYQQGDDQYVYGQQGQQQQQQMYNTYQPPQSATARGQGSAEATEPTSLKMNARNEAVLSYLFWGISGLVFLVLERKNRFVRFHAAQSFIFLGSAMVVYIVFRLITIIPLIGFLLSPIISCLTFVIFIPAALIWLFLMLQAYRGAKTKLPIVGDYAEVLAERFTKRKKSSVA